MRTSTSHVTVKAAWEWHPTTFFFFFTSEWRRPTRTRHRHTVYLLNLYTYSPWRRGLRSANMSFSGGQKAKMAMCCMEFKKLAYLVETEDGNLVELSSQVVKRTSVSNLQTLEMIDCCRLGSTPPSPQFQRIIFGIGHSPWWMAVADISARIPTMHQQFANVKAILVRSSYTN